MATNWQSAPGYYLSNDGYILEVIHCTGVKKGNKYYRFSFDENWSDGWLSLLWNCIDTSQHTRYDTLDEIRALIHAPAILASL